MPVFGRQDIVDGWVAVREDVDGFENSQAPEIHKLKLSVLSRRILGRAARTGSQEFDINLTATGHIKRVVRHLAQESTLVVVIRDRRTCKIVLRPEDGGDAKSVGEPDD